MTAAGDGIPTQADESSPAYQWAYHLTQEHGIDAAIEIQAEFYDSLFPGLGGVLRTAWESIRGDFERTPAYLSGASDEFAYYAGEDE